MKRVVSLRSRAVTGVVPDRGQPPRAGRVGAARGLLHRAPLLPSHGGRLPTYPERGRAASIQGDK